jgi:hypothetical protein
MGAVVSIFTLFSLVTLAGVAIAGSSYGNGSLDGAIGVLGGAILAAVGLVGAVVSVSGPVGTYSLCLEHDARIARLRLSGNLPEDTEWESAPELSSVRESVQRLYFSMNDGSEFEGTLIEVREDELLVLFEDESLRERNETEELRWVPLGEITYIEEAPFSNSGDAWFATWRPKEHDIQELTRVSFRK